MRGVYSSFAQVDDIINEGVLALVGAIDKFDPDKGIKFETFVSKRIRGAVIDLARRQDWVPRSVRRKAREIDQASVELFAELGQGPLQILTAAAFIEEEEVLLAHGVQLRLGIGERLELQLVPRARHTAAALLSGRPAASRGSVTLPRDWICTSLVISLKASTYRLG